MNYQVCDVSESDKEALADLRTSAMKESLLAIGYFDAERTRNSFLDEFSRSETKKILSEGELVGFYVVKNKIDHLFLNHFYISPRFQNSGLGSDILTTIKSTARNANLSISLSALRGSQANQFYKKHGFVYDYDDEFATYYKFKSK